MTDTEILNWLEENMEEFIPIPPSKKEEENEWSIYQDGHIFYGRGPTLRKCVENCVKRVEVHKSIHKK